jgi:hypothetical protein
MKGLLLRATWFSSTRLLTLFATIFFFFGTAYQGQAQSTDWVTFTGSQVLPPTSTMGTALGYFALNPNGSVTYSIQSAGLSGPVVAAHMHTGNCGQNGGINLPLVVNGNPITGTTPVLSAGSQAALMAGQMYVDLHTAAFAGGEVRAQLFAASCAGSAGIDCNNNNFPDQCDISCGAVGTPCHVPGCGAADDNNNNGKPDSCDVTYDIYGVNSANQLIRINRSTYAEKIIGSLSVGLNSLAYDSVSDQMYGIATNGTIYLVNYLTAAVAPAPIQPFGGFANPFFLSIGFAKQGTQKFLYFANGSHGTGNTEFYRVNLNVPPPYPVTQLGSIKFGASSFRQTGGFAYDPNTDTLYASSRNTGSLITVNKSTGAVLSFLSHAGINNMSDIDFDPQDGNLYGEFDIGPTGKFTLPSGVATVVAQTSNAGTLTFAPRGAQGLPGPYIVGEEIPHLLESGHPYTYLGPKVFKRKKNPAHTFTIHHPGATYIAPHFSKFSLHDRDYVVVRSPDHSRKWKYEGEGKEGLGVTPEGFWGIHIPGDTAIIEIHQFASSNAYGFQIDKYARGFTTLEAEGQSYNKTEAICAPDDSLEAKCYSSSHPDVYGRGKPVARLLIKGTNLCTGFLFGSEGHILTNHHCISKGSHARNTDVEFLAEGANCSTNCQSANACPGTVEADSSKLIVASKESDFALIKPKTKTNLSAKYGYLRARTNGTVVNEKVYIPQHPAGFGKRIALNSTDSNDQSGFAEVASLSQNSCTGDGDVDIGYFADTQGGSSGSPLLASQDNLIIGLHHCGACPNSAVNITNVIKELSTDLPDCARITDLNCPASVVGQANVPECTTCTNNSQCVSPAVCFQQRCVLAGYSRAVGEECCVDAQCTNNTCSTGGFCECLTDADCASGDSCLDAVNGKVCIKTGSKTECEGCLFNSQCVSGNCKNFKCITPQTVGIGSECCRDDQCLSNSCSAADTCQCKLDSDCPAGNYCDTGFLTLGANSCKVQKLSCDSCSADKQCGPGMHCQGKPFGHCITGVENFAIGHSCCKDDQCTTNSCSNKNNTCQCKHDSDCPSGQLCKGGFMGIGPNSCVVLKSDCQDCVKDSQCGGPGAQCKFFKCATPNSLGAGATCCRDYQCTSGKCKNKKCK